MGTVDVDEGFGEDGEEEELPILTDVCLSACLGVQYSFIDDKG